MSLSHWLIVAVVVLLLFGRGKISELMGDMAKGIKSFKQGLADDDDTARPTSVPVTPATARTIEYQTADTTTVPGTIPTAVPTAVPTPVSTPIAPAEPVPGSVERTDTKIS